METLGSGPAPALLGFSSLKEKLSGLFAFIKSL